MEEIDGMRIAVASSDGKMVNEHFGRATQFLVMDVHDGKIELVEARESAPACGTSEYSRSRGQRSY